MLGSFRMSRTFVFHSLCVMKETKRKGHRMQGREELRGLKPLRLGVFRPLCAFEASTWSSICLAFDGAFVGFGGGKVNDSGL